jgi:hypothetical protein
MRTPILTAFLLCVLGSAESLANPIPSCEFSPDDLKLSYSDAHPKSPMTSEQFFSLPPGAVAIGEKCDPSTNRCEKNLVVTDCTEVGYPVDVFQDPSFNIVINTSLGCADAESCPTESAYLAAAVVYINTDYSYSNLPKVEVIRNSGWFKPAYPFPQRHYEHFLDTLVSPQRINKFFKMQAEQNALPGLFDRDVVKYFHASPGRRESDIRSWDRREIFGMAFTRLRRCRDDDNRCTLKAYLEKFSETARGIPTTALRINGALSQAEGIDVKTLSPIGGGIYNFEKTIYFNRPAPLPLPRPVAEAEPR